MKILIFIISLGVVASQKDDWVWKDDRQRGRSFDRNRYLVNENFEDLNNDGHLIGFRPQNPGPYGPDSRPIVPAYQGNKGILVGPGGPTGIIKRPHYPDGGHINDGISDSGFLPPWIKDDPRYREYDTCRCRYSFNCPSTGLKFGTCSKDKKYCCFNSRKYPSLVGGHFGEGQHSSYPGAPHKYGPVGFASPTNNYDNRRPYDNLNSGHRYPHGNYQFSGGDSSHYPRPQSNPYDNYDYESDGFDFYARSLNKNQTETESKANGKSP